MVIKDGRLGGSRRFTGVNMAAHLAPPIDKELQCKKQS